MTMTEARLRLAASAAHRFGLGEPRLAPLSADPQAWLLAQLGPGDRALGDGLLDSAAALERLRRPAANRAEATREIVLADQRSRQLTALATARPFAERLVRFWANHFTVSLAKGAARGLVGRSSARRSGRTSTALSSSCCGRPPPTPRCCVTWTTSSLPGRARASSAALPGAPSAWARKRGSAG
jgi:hypothetical protein